MILDDRHLHRLVKEYKSTFNCARPHQGIEQCIPCRIEQGDGRPANPRLSSQPVLNGLHHEYSWRAASSARQNHTQRLTHQ